MIRTSPISEKVERQRALLAGAHLPTKEAVTAAVGKLPAMIKDAAKKLATAVSAAEVLDVIDATGLAYDASKRAGRIAKAKGAHDTVVAAAHRAQADALEIEAAAKRRLADEYDAAQDRGEVATAADTQKRGPGVPEQNAGKATAADAGLTRKQVHEARRVRNAEKVAPGVVKGALDQAIAEGKEPTRAVVNAAVAEALGEEPSAKRDRNGYDAIVEAWTSATPEDRDAFVAYLRVCGVINSQAKASEDNGATVQGEDSLADSVAGDVSRPGRGGGTPASNSETPDTSSHPVTTPALPTSSSVARATLSKADTIRRIRPHCQHLDDLENCGGAGREHCGPCKKLMAESEAAA
jgi:hypothetical protein